MFPPAASVICGTLAGVCFWGFSVPEGGLCSKAEEVGGTDGISRIQEVFPELIPAVLPIVFGVTVLVAVVFLTGVFLLRRNAPPRPVFFSCKPKKYISVSYLRYRYGLPVYCMGLLALFFIGFIHGFQRQIPSEISFRDLFSGSLNGSELSVTGGDSLQVSVAGSVLPGSVLPEEEQVFLCLRVTDFPVHVTTASAREYMRMECRLVFYSPDGKKQIPGFENIQAFIAIDTIGTSGSGNSGFGNSKSDFESAISHTDHGDSINARWLPGDMLITRCRTFPFNSYQPATTTDSTTTTDGTTTKSPTTTTFDYAKYMARRGFFRRAYIYDFQRISGELTVFERLKRLRVPITGSWKGEAGALLAGICLGDKTGLTREMRDRFSAAGAGHILAVSGLHVGILYGSLVLLLGLPFRITEYRRYKHKRSRRAKRANSHQTGNPATAETPAAIDIPTAAGSLAAIDISTAAGSPAVIRSRDQAGRKITIPENAESSPIVRSRELYLQRTYSLTRGTWIHVPALLLIWLYAAVAGFSASVVRAALMLTIYGIGKMTGRRSLGMNVLSLTAIILVLIEPMNLYDIGFQMSFSAVLGLILFFPLLRNLLSVRNRFLKYIWELFCCSLAVQMGTLWLTTASFGIIPVYGLFCNLAVVPFCTIILYVFLCNLILLGFSTFIISSSVADFTQTSLQSLNEILHFLAGWLEKTVSFFAELPYTPIFYQPGPGGQILILLCTLVVYILLRKNDRNF